VLVKVIEWRRRNGPGIKWEEWWTRRWGFGGEAGRFRVWSVGGWPYFGSMC
jgi:hypothetical protein